MRQQKRETAGQRWRDIKRDRQQERERQQKRQTAGEREREREQKRQTAGERDRETGKERQQEKERERERDSKGERDSKRERETWWRWAVAAVSPAATPTGPALPLYCRRRPRLPLDRWQWRGSHLQGLDGT